MISEWAQIEEFCHSVIINRSYNNKANGTKQNIQRHCISCIHTVACLGSLGRSVWKCISMKTMQEYKNCASTSGNEWKFMRSWRAKRRCQKTWTSTWKSALSVFFRGSRAISMACAAVHSTQHNPEKKVLLILFILLMCCAMCILYTEYGHSHTDTSKPFRA